MKINIGDLVTHTPSGLQGTVYSKIKTKHGKELEMECWRNHDQFPYDCRKQKIRGARELFKKIQ